MYACTIEIPIGPVWLSHYTKNCTTEKQATEIFNKYCKTLRVPGAEVIEVWETNEADWCALMLQDKEVL